MELSSKTQITLSLLITNILPRSEEQNHCSMKKKSPYEGLLLKYAANNTICKIIPMNLIGLKVEKLSKNKILAIIPNKLGEYVNEIPFHCKIKIEHFSLSVYEELWNQLFTNYKLMDNYFMY